MAVSSTDPSLPSRRLALRTMALAATAASFLSSGCASASAGAGAAAGPPVEMQIVDRETGRPLQTYHREGRSYVAGRPSSRYAIRLTNRGGERVLVVLSVDGINVISGETAAYAQTGYVLDPWRSADIAGWRKSDTVIAAFEFAALSRSYAARTGRPDNVGIIGAAVFRERPPPPPPVALETAPHAAAKALADAPAAAPSLQGSGAVAERRAEQSAERLGTAHGSREWSVASRTNFERESETPQAVVEIAYDSMSNLIAAGIVRAPLAQWRPRPFPAETGGAYVPDPPP